MLSIMRKINTVILLCMILGIMSCNNSKTTASNDNTPKVEIPAFNADSAYSFVEKQVSFGPRVPNTEGHRACSEYLVSKLKSYGAEVVTQEFEAIRYDNEIMRAKNIIASFNPDNMKRVLLCAHWDTRPWADNDSNKDNYHTPIDGANDGGSGVGVLLEIARLISQNKPTIGIDIVMFDAEDSGTPRFHDGQYDETTWCLGAQYWSHNPHKRGYSARYGILLDMVGAPDAVFCREGFSTDYANTVVNKIWNKASELGYSGIFSNQESGYITDDHVPVNLIARIPCVDIIHNDPNNGGFGEFWHTVNDTMEGIDKEMLHKVGNLVVNVIYTEK